MLSAEHMNELICKLDNYDYTQRQVIDIAYHQGREDAIDEFMETMELWGNNIKEIRGTVPFFTIDNIRKISEQIKETMKDE